MTHDFEEFLSRPHTSWTGRTGKTPPQIADEAGDAVDGRYRAFGSTPTDELDACNVSWWLTADVPQGQEFQYRFLLRVGYIGDTTLHLFLTDCIIHIEGRNLGELRKRLARQKVTFIQAFNPNVWAASGPNEAHIERITLLDPANAI